MSVEENEIDDESCDIIKSQQHFYELFGYKSEIVYDIYQVVSDVLPKISILFPEMESKDTRHLVNTIWSQRKYSGYNHLLMSPIFVYCVQDFDSEKLSYPLNIKSKRFSVHSVFRIQKCVSKCLSKRSQASCCSIFVDEFARVYPSWNDFCNNNKYGSGLFVAPKSGIYNGTATNEVMLEIFERKDGVVKKVDVGSTLLSVAALGVTAVAAIPAVTLAPVVVTGAAAVGVATAVYTGLRSAYNLYDRKRHQQPIGLKNKEARSDWFFVASGGLCASSAGAARVVQKAAENGKNISNLARNGVRAFNIGSKAMMFSGGINECCSIFTDIVNGKSISDQQLLRYSGYLFLLTNSMTNVRLAEELLRCFEWANIVVAQMQKLCEIISETMHYFVQQTHRIRPVDVECGRIIIRPIKRLGDPDMIIKVIRIAIVPSAKNKLEQCYNLIAETVMNEYRRSFQQYTDRFFNSLAKKIHIPLGELTQEFMRVLKRFSIKTFEKVMRYVEEYVLHMMKSAQRRFESINFRYILRQFNSQLEGSYAQSPFCNTLDFNEFVASIDDKEFKKIEHKVTARLEDLSVAEIQNSITTIANENPIEMSDNRIAKLWGEKRCEEYTHIIEKWRIDLPAPKKDELLETIEFILKQLPSESAAIFFTLAEKIIDANGNKIQVSLGRYIPLDVFITDVYCLIGKLSAENGDSVETYLSKYDNDKDGEMHKHIDAKFVQKYALEQDSTMKKVNCSTCGGTTYQ